MMRSVALVLTLGLVVAARADGGDDKQKPPAPAPAEGGKAETKSESKKDGETPQGAAPAESDDALPPVRGTRYQITLRTGRTLTGVVTCEKVFERRSGVDWVVCDKDAPGAGVRLFFVKDADGFVFVLTKDMKSAEKQDEITDREGRDLAKRRAVAERRAAEERDELRKERLRREAMAKDKSAGDAKGDGKEPSSKTPEAQFARYAELLTKYPPGKWTLDTPKDLERRRIVMDLFPNEEEKAFLAVFDDWSKAYAAWKAAHDAEKPADGAGDSKSADETKK